MVSVCMRANMDEYKEKNKKEPYTLGGWRTQCADALRADINGGKEKEKKKKTYLRFGCVDADALCVDGLVCGWSCVWMVLHADSLACGCRSWWL